MQNIIYEFFAGTLIISVTLIKTYCVENEEIKMRIKLVVSCLLFFMMAGVTFAGDWETDFEKAQAKAEKEGKPMLVDFTGSDWCGWCIKLDEEVFSKKEFQKWAAENVVLVKLDFPKRTKQSSKLKKQNAELAKKYEVRGFPTILFLDAKGKVIGKSGYMAGGPSAWTKSADSIIK